MEIKQAKAADYEGIAGLINHLYAEANTSGAEMAKDDQQRDPKYKLQRWVAIEQEQVVGAGSYSQTFWFDHPQKFMIWVGVRPENQRHGIGSALYQAILDGLQPFEPLALRATASEERRESVRFLEKHGFREVIRDIPSMLDVQSFDPQRFLGAEDRFREQGIEIKTLPELAGDPERDQKLYDLDWELSLSVPGDLAAGIGRRGLDQYVEYAITGPGAIPEGFFVALKGDDYIGLSHVLMMEKGVSLYQGLTGVKPAYRRLGIGIALKLRAIAFAKAQGYATIKAENDAKNLPMLKMNQRLGYVQMPSTITFEKQC